MPLCERWGDRSSSESVAAHSAAFGPVLDCACRSGFRSSPLRIVARCERSGPPVGTIRSSREFFTASTTSSGYSPLQFFTDKRRSVHHHQITTSAAEFAGPFAVAIARWADRGKTLGPRLNILVPVTGTTTSRHGAEMAIALARAARGSLTALHFTPRSAPAVVRSWQRQIGAAVAPLTSAEAVLREIVRLGDLYGVAVKSAVRSAGAPEDAILGQIATGQHNLLVMGVSPRPGDQLFFGKTAAALLEKAECSLMFVVSEQFMAVPKEDRQPERMRA